jgi:hypothetical protein
MSCHAADRSDLLDLFSTRSCHLFRADDGMATAVFGGVVPSASMRFLWPTRAKIITGQSPLPKRESAMRRIAPAIGFLLAIRSRVMAPAAELIHLIAGRSQSKRPVVGVRRFQNR